MSASQPIRPSALGISPTPLHRLEGLELLIKREDLCGVAAGGCKTRKLTALLADAQSVSATVVLTTGYASVVPELLAQLGPQAPMHLVTAAGSLGTMVGVILGTWAAGLDCQVHGYSVLWPEQHARDRLEQLLEDSRREYFPSVAARPNYRLDSSELGAGYGIPTSAGRDAARLAARRDGFLLDSTYTAKAMAGLIHGITAGTYRRGDKVVFFHTGGLGGLLAGADTADPPLSISDGQHQRPAAAPTGSDSYEQ
jgi:1-aminocyclopropane-1-carboxylate deaminase/D-cysteine desulfhydrase-like pyridoxal-dependent ACC family enzyme